MWQDPYGIRWAEENGVLYIQGGGKREPLDVYKRQVYQRIRLSLVPS